MNDVADRLDAALAGQPDRGADLIPLLRTLAVLEPLRRVPPRSPDSEQRGLQTFLSQASALRPAVSARPAPRHTGWRFKFKKETSPMKVLLIISLVAALGGAGVTAYAAQDSLPTETLYAVKLVAEDVRLGLASDPQAQLNLLLEMVQARTTEMTALAARGEPIPGPVLVRLQTHLEAALQIAAQLGEPEMAAALEQIRASVETQAQAMLQAQQNAPGDSGLQLAQQTLTQTRERVELGLSDPALFRNRVNQNRPEAAPTQPDLMPGTGNDNGAGPQPSRTSAPSGTPQPGSGNGNGPGYQASGTPPPAYTPQGTSSGQGNGYGPGLEATCTCTPEYDGNSYGPGSGDNSSATPQGNSYGPGPDATGTCTPEYDGNSYGSGPGNPSVTPGGDNNSYGPGPQPTATLPPPNNSQPGNGGKP